MSRSFSNNLNNISNNHSKSPKNKTSKIKKKRHSNEALQRKKSKNELLFEEMFNSYECVNKMNTVNLLNERISLIF